MSRRPRPARVGGVARLRAALARVLHRPPLPEVHDVWTRTERELRLEEVRDRQRRYLLTGPPMLALLMTGLLLPGPGWLRVVLLLGAALLAPVALASTVPRRW